MAMATMCVFLAFLWWEYRESNRFVDDFVAENANWVERKYAHPKWIDSVHHRWLGILGKDASFSKPLFLPWFDSIHCVQVTMIGDYSPEWFDRLAQVQGVERIYLEDCGLTPQAVRKLSALKRVEQLSLHGITLNTEHFQEIGRFSNLKTLSISPSEDRPGLITGIHALRSLAHLVKLHLYNPPMDDVEFEGLLALKSLRDLEVWEVSLTQRSLRAIEELVWLKTLDLTFCNLNSRQIDLSGLESLETLRLLGIPREAVSFSQLANLKHLEELSLSLSEEGVGDDQVRQLVHCRKLRNLYLSDSTLEGIAFDSPGWEQLESLSLDDCPISADGVNAIAKLPNLIKLELSDISVSDDQMTRMFEPVEKRQPQR